MTKHRIIWLAVAVILASSSVSAEDNPTFTLSPVMVNAKPEKKDIVGPYNQPRWAAKGRFTPNSDVYVLPPYTFVVDLDYQATIPKHGTTNHLFTQEFELGLPHRFQIAYENNAEVNRRKSQETVQTIEARYALADWGKIPLNPTLFAEYKFGIGKDYAEQDDPDDPVQRIPDGFELRLLLGEQFGKDYQWAMNIFHEQETGGDREYETGFSQALSYAILDEDLKAGLEMLFIRRTDAESRSHPEYEFDLGPNISWKPSQRTQLDLAMMFGTTSDSPSANIFVVFSYSFGKGEENEFAAPVSTRNR